VPETQDWHEVADPAQVEQGEVQPEHSVELEAYVPEGHVV